MPTDIKQMKSDLEHVSQQRDRAVALLESAQSRADEWKRRYDEACKVIVSLTDEWEQRYFKLSRDYSDLVGEVTMEALAPL